MSTISTAEDFLRLLREDPEFRAQVRHELQIQELMELPGKFAAFVSQTQEEFSEIKSRLTRLEEIVAGQQTAISDLQESVAKLQVSVAELQESVAKLQVSVAELQVSVAKLQVSVAELQEIVAAQQTAIAELQESVVELRIAVIKLQKTVDAHQELLIRMDGRLGRLEGAEYERRVSRTFMGALNIALGGLRRGRLVHSGDYGTIPEFFELMENSADDDKIAFSQWYEIMGADAVVRGVKDGETVYAVAEISLTVHQNDIDRAAERAAIVQQATGAAVYPVVVGDSVPFPQQAQADSKGVTVIIIQQ